MPERDRLEQASLGMMSRSPSAPPTARTTTSGRYIPQLDGLRAVALTMVVLFHAEVILNVVSGFSRISPPFGAVRRIPGRIPPVDGLSRVLLQGYFGIYLFFILSGFVLAMPFVERRLREGPGVDFRKFYVRRVTRLQVPYTLALTIFTFVGLVTGGIGATAALRHYGASLVYLHGPLIGGVNPANGPLWTMEVEIQFYLLLPIVALLLRVAPAGLRLGSMAGVAVAAILWQAYAPPDSSFFFVSVGYFLQFFLVGFTLADVYVTRWRGAARTGLWDLATVVGWPLFFIVAMRGSKPFDQGLLPWMAMIPLAGAIRGRVTGRLLGNRWAATLGAASFSIYLVHYPLLVLAGRILRPALTGSHHLDWLLILAVGVPVVGLAGWAFFRFVERPCMDPAWPRKVARRLGILVGSTGRGRSPT